MPDADAAGARTAADQRADTANIKIAWIALALALGLSYRGLFDFARHRAEFPFLAAIIFPLIIDLFPVMGELRLYSATRQGGSAWIKAWGWALVLAGLAASATANAAGAGPGIWMKLATAAAPVAAAAALGNGLGLVKRRYRDQAPERGRDGARIPRSVSAAHPVTARPRARRRTATPAADQVPALVPRLIEDRQAGHFPMGKAAVARRYGISEHLARLALAASNGSGDQAHAG